MRNYKSLDDCRWTARNTDLEKCRPIRFVSDYHESLFEGPEVLLERVEDVAAVRGVLGSLSRYQLVVLRLRFGLDGDEPQTLEAVGATLDVGKERVRRIQKDALKHLRWELVRRSTTLERLLLEGGSL